MSAHESQIGLIARVRRLGMPDLAVAIILLAAIFFGGGGRGAPLANLVVQIAAIGTLVVFRDRIAAGWSRSSWFLRIALLAAIALPLLQIIPLPSAWWQALPGREVVTSSLSLVDAEDMWRPFSVDPANTALALSGLIAPAILLLATLGHRSPPAIPIMISVIGASLLVVLIGAIQLSTGGAIASFYHAREPDYLLGTFANHNSTGLFLLVALCCLIEVSVRKRGAGAYALMAWLLGGLLTLAILLTQSRSSIVLLLVPAALLVTRFLSREKTFHVNRRAALGGIVALFALGALGWAVSGNERVSSSIDRFSDIETARVELWTDTIVSAERFFPLGSGMGTFDEVIQLDESLETIKPQRAGRAHNDYLELLVEGGIVSVSVLFIWLAYIGTRLLGKRRADAASKPFIVAITLLYALQSVLDYPLRSQALLCLAAAMIALIESGRASAKGWDNAV